MHRLITCFLILFLLVVASVSCKEAQVTCGYCGNTPGDKFILQYTGLPSCPGKQDGPTCSVEITVGKDGCYQIENCEHWYSVIPQIERQKIERMFQLLKKE